MWDVLHATSCTLTLTPTPHTLHPYPYPYTPHPAPLPLPLDPTPCTLTLTPTPHTLHHYPHPYTPQPAPLPSPLHPTPCTLHPTPWAYALHSGHPPYTLVTLHPGLRPTPHTAHPSGPCGRRGGRAVCQRWGGLCWMSFSQDSNHTPKRAPFRVSLEKGQESGGGGVDGPGGERMRFVQARPLRATVQVSPLSKVRRFRGGLVFKAHRLLYHSTLGSREIKKKKKKRRAEPHGRLRRFR